VDPVGETTQVGRRKKAQVSNLRLSKSEFGTGQTSTYGLSHKMPSALAWATAWVRLWTPSLP
jgi:hypothetical protein